MIPIDRRMTGYIRIPRILMLELIGQVMYVRT